MEVNRIVTGNLDTNTYIVSKNGKCFIIDPAGDGESIVRFIESKNLNPLFIINTHEHIDHIEANDVLKEKFGINVFAHKKAVNYFKDPWKNLSAYMDNPVEVSSPDVLLDHNESISFEGVEFKIFYTPGHSPCSICIFSEEIVFTGDLIFVDSVGRTDLPESSTELLYESINMLIDVFEDKDKMIVYPGHGEHADFDYILSSNPFI